MNALSTLLRPWIRTCVLLLAGALPLQAFALQCQVRCALAGTAVPTSLHADEASEVVSNVATDMAATLAGKLTRTDGLAGHDCHGEGDAADECPNGAQCAAAQAIALPVTDAAQGVAGIDLVSAQAVPDRLSHTPLPPERPPRRG